MDGLQVRELVVIRIHADAEEQTSVAPVHDLVVSELHEPFSRPDEMHGYSDVPLQSSIGISGLGELPDGGPRLLGGPTQSAP